MQSKFQEVMSFLQFEIVDGRVICLYRCSTGPKQALGCDSWEEKKTVLHKIIGENFFPFLTHCIDNFVPSCTGVPKS